MSKIRLYPIKENTIASGSAFENINSSQENVSNLWYGGGVGTDNLSNGRNSISRHLVQFDFSELQGKYADFTINSAFTTSYVLKYKNAIPSDVILEPEFTFDVLNKSIASSFSLIFFPINKKWDEGRGGSLESGFITFRNAPTSLSAVSNWLSASTFVSWDNPGIFTDPSAQTTNYVYQNFPIGSEDISVDVSDIVNYWLSGNPNYGLAIAYSRPFELMSTDTRSIASFYTNKINSSAKPYLEVTYNQTIRDDRHFVTNNRTSRLFLYLFSGNQATNYFSAGTVTITNSANAVIYSGLTPTQFSKGCYYVDILMSGATKGQRYKDTWNGVMIGMYDQTNFVNSFDIKDNYYNNNNKRVNDYTIDIFGIPNNSILNSGEIYRIYADTRMSYSTQKPTVDFGLEYRITMGTIDEIIPWTAMNNAIINDCLSSYFDLDTSWLLNSQSYKIEFRISEFGTKRLIPDTLIFKVVNPI